MRFMVLVKADKDSEAGVLQRLPLAEATVTTSPGS